MGEGVGVVIQLDTFSTIVFLPGKDPRSASKIFFIRSSRSAESNVRLGTGENVNGPLFALVYAYD